MLPKKYRLPAKLFRSIYTRGNKYRGQYGMLIANPTSSPTPRFGFVVSKKIGNAVFRHHMTRLLRNIVLEAVKEYGLDQKPKDFEYIAFVFCDDYFLLKEELFKQIASTLNA
jgi:ribonuclease P protein component